MYYTNMHGNKNHPTIFSFFTDPEFKKDRDAISKKVSNFFKTVTGNNKLKPKPKKEKQSGLELVGSCDFTEIDLNK